MNELLSLIKCILGSNKATYFSIPVTTGERFLKWYEAKGISITNENDYKRFHEVEVMQKNIEEALISIEQLRHKLNRYVIEPVSLMVENWSQKDYYNFWTEVINQYINEAYFFPGWHLSKGCAIEFLTCKKKEIPVYNIDGIKITQAMGIDCLKVSVKRYESLGLDTKFLENVLGQLEEVCVTN